MAGTSGTSILSPLAKLQCAGIAGQDSFQPKQPGGKLYTLSTVELTSRSGGASVGTLKPSFKVHMWPRRFLELQVLGVMVPCLPIRYDNTVNEGPFIIDQDIYPQVQLPMLDPLSA